MTNTLESIARGESDVDVARSQITHHIEATLDIAKPYSALLRWAWLALSERRADDDLRHWHRLILDVAARASQLETSADNAQDRAPGPGALLSERLRALSDMIRVSIGMQTRPDRARLLTRAHVPAILDALYDRRSEAVAREELLQAVGLKTANLSRILTLLILEGLVERRPDGRTALFCITGEGITQLSEYKARLNAAVEKSTPMPIVSTPAIRHGKKPSFLEAEPERILIEADRAHFEGDNYRSKGRNLQIKRRKGALALTKTASHAKSQTRTKGAEVSLPTHNTTAPDSVADVNMAKPMAAFGAEKHGRLVELGKARAKDDHVTFVMPTYPAKPEGPEYKPLFDPVLPTHALEKSLHG